MSRGEKSTRKPKKRPKATRPIPIPPPPTAGGDDDPYDGTPRNYPTSHQFDLIQFPLDISRMLLRADIVGLPKVPYNFFKSEALPELNVNYVSDIDATIDLVYNTCVEKGLIVNGRFVHFQKSPAMMKEDYKRAKEAKSGKKVTGSDDEHDDDVEDEEDYEEEDEDEEEEEEEEEDKDKDKDKDGEVYEDKDDDDDDDDDDEDDKVNEDTIFVNMKTLWEDVLEVAKGLVELSATVEYLHTPNANALMERPEGFKSDAISYLIQSKMPSRFDKYSRHFLCNCAVLKEDKVKNKKASREDNMSKMCYGCNHMFANDPLRRGVYGITVEDINLRLWLFCRSGGVVAEALNWVENVRELIGVILRLSFASHTALGFDETMGRYWIDSRPIDNNLQYWILVGNRRFRTVGHPLFDRQANLFVGSGTRVFAAIETELQGTDTTNTGPKFAVKVTWVKEGSTREGEKVKELRAKAAKTGDECWFPKVIAEWVPQVRNHKGVNVDDKTSLFVRKSLRPVSKGFYPGPTLINQGRKGTNPILGSAIQSSSGGHNSAPRLVSVTGLSGTNYTNPDVQDFLKVRWVDRYQYRIVFEGIGTPLADLDTIYDIFHGLRDGVKGIKVLHKLGHVHRDLSIGNFLIHRSRSKRTWQLKLSDFEYVRKISHFRNDEQIMTGTRQFMALEVLCKKYLYWNLARQQLQTGNLNEPPSRVAVLEQPKCDFHYNPLHDLEPFFWMSLWFLLYSVPVNPTKPIPDDVLEKQLDCAEELFYDPFASEGVSSLRYGCLTGGMENLHTVLEKIPEDFALLKPQIKELGQHILSCYIKYEGLPNFDGANTPELLHMCPEWMYDRMEAIFDTCMTMYANDHVSIKHGERPEIRIPKSPKQKKSKGD